MEPELSLLTELRSVLAPPLPSTETGCKFLTAAAPTTMVGSDNSLVPPMLRRLAESLDLLLLLAMKSEVSLLPPLTEKALLELLLTSLFLLDPVPFDPNSEEIQSVKFRLAVHSLSDGTPSLARTTKSTLTLTATLEDLKMLLLRSSTLSTSTVDSTESISTLALLSTESKSLLLTLKDALPSAQTSLKSPLPLFLLLVFPNTTLTSKTALYVSTGMKLPRPQLPSPNTPFNWLLKHNSMANLPTGLLS